MSKIFTKVFYAFAVITFFAVALPADAQVTFNKTTVETGGLYSALAKDASNNVYVIRVTAGSGGTSGEVVKYTGITPKVIYTGLHEGDDTGPGGDLPWGLAVTSNGDVYVSTDFASASGKIIKLKFSGGTYTPSTFQSGAYYTALAVDAGNNLYTTQYDGATHYAIYKYAANSVGGTPGVKLYGNLKQATGYSYPTGLAIATNGDIYVTDAFAQDPTLPTDGGHVYKLTAASNFATVVTVSTGHYATALALDAAGNLYTSENTGVDVNGYKLLKYTNGGGTPAVAYTPMHTNGIYYPFGIAPISAASVYAIDGDDGTTGGSLYNLTLSTNALLSSLKINPNTTITTVTGPGYKNYTTAVPNSETSLTVTSVVQDATAVITVNGTTVASGAASSAIPLMVGANVITVAVTAQDGATVKNYILTATRASSSIATLANLTTSAGTLTPAFAALTTAYTLHVPNATTSIKLTPTATAGDASITVNGTAVVSGAASANIPLSVGDNMINTVVTASDGTTTKTYTLTVTRSAAGLSTNALLSSLKINPSTTITTVSGPAYKNYTTAVPNSETSLTVTSVVQDATAVITVNGTTVASGAASPAIPLMVGANVITIAVTAQDGATVKNYILTATRASSSIATLSNLTTSAGTLNPVFASSTTAYTANVPNATTSIKLTPTATAGDASIKINGTTVLSGAASANIPLSVGDNMINTVVTASDGTTIKTYTLTVTRSAAGLSTNALLSSIKINPSTTITTVSGPGYKNYTTAVPNSETSLTVTSVVQDATATITVNGTTVASGAASPSIALAVGSTVINIVVTAQDGATTKNYIITATRSAPVAGLALAAESPDSLKATDGVIVHPGVSPNGDGISDYLVIDGLSAYPDNSLSIATKSGALIYRAKGYNNISVVFDGHSSLNGRLQPRGTYFYLLEYFNGTQYKRKSGFIIIKY